MPQASRKKSPAQLDREIAEALRGKKKPKAPKRRTASRGRTTRAHAVRHVRGGDKKQAAILMVANDAALSDQFDQAEELLAQSTQRAIATAYQTVTPESAAEGDVADRGWEDQDGDSIEVSSYDIEEARGEGSHAPVTDAIVKQAVRWLRDHGANETSSSSYHAGVWYSSPSEVTDYSTGEERSEDFFLRNFTDKEERLVFVEFKRGRRR